MSLDEELKRLQDRAATLDEAVKDLDYEIERAMHAVAGGTDDVGRAMMLLTERRNTQLGLMFELGKVTACIDDLENREREQTERGGERQAVQDWDAERPVAAEDHLDWLRPALEETDSERRDGPVQEREPAQDETRRDGQEPENHLDWWDNRR